MGLGSRVTLPVLAGLAVLVCAFLALAPLQGPGCR
jgi:hypothetical protein